VPLEIDPIQARANGGSDWVSNRTLACIPCNQARNNQAVKAFLVHDPARLTRIQAQAKAPRNDAAAVNSTRYAIGNALQQTGLPVSFSTGGRTKWNRTRQGYSKDDWTDAACVGETGAKVRIPFNRVPLTLTAMGRGRRRVHRNDRYGFPKGKPRSIKRVQGFQTGDLAELRCAKGKSAGVHVGRIASIRARGRFKLNKHDRPACKFRLLQRADGHEYTTPMTVQ
jgi:hypothetical protein